MPEITEEQLTEWSALCDLLTNHPIRVSTDEAALVWSEYMPALIAEVRGLRIELERHEQTLANYREGLRRFAGIEDA